MTLDEIKTAVRCENSMATPYRIGFYVGEHGLVKECPYKDGTRGLKNYLDGLGAGVLYRARSAKEEP